MKNCKESSEFHRSPIKLRPRRVQNTAAVGVASPPTTFPCKICSRIYKSKGGRAQHERKCVKISPQQQEQYSIPSSVPAMEHLNLNSRFSGPSNLFDCSHATFPKPVNSGRSTNGYPNDSPDKHPDKLRCSRTSVPDTPFHLTLSPSTPSLNQSTLAKYAMKDTISWPTSDAQWSEYNDLISAFHSQATPPLEIDDSLELLLEHLHLIASDMFKDAKQTTYYHNKQKDRQMKKSLSKLRQRKSKARRQWRKASKMPSDSTRMEDLRKTYWTLCKLYNAERAKQKRIKETMMGHIHFKQFKKNPFQFAKRHLSTKTVIKHEPDFTQSTAEAYFKHIYLDPRRNTHTYTTPDYLQNIPPPTTPFPTTVPSISEYTRYLKSRKTSSSPGLDRIPYIVFRKCPAAMKWLYEIFTRIWNTGDIPKRFGVATAILLPKSSTFTDPKEFRPIVLLSSVSKLFWAIVQQRLQRFMVDNRYIDQNIQKGFMEKQSGCLEHNDLLFEALRDARLSKRQILVTWIDLVNAYGSVTHLFAQRSLEHYHIPSSIRAMIWKHYEALICSWKTKAWTTEFIRFEAGMMQGCTLSTILFLIVMNSLDLFLKQQQSPPYTFKTMTPDEPPIQLSNQFFVDDITAVDFNQQHHQRHLDTINTWLYSTETMRAKPAKCCNLSFKLTATPGHRTWAQYDPKVQIDNQPVRILQDAKFKHLGRKFDVSTTDESNQKDTLKLIEQDLKTTDAFHLPSTAKLWIYNKYITAKYRWFCSVYSLPESFGTRADTICRKFLKKWCQIPTRCNHNILYMTHKNHGVNLTSFSVMVKHGQCLKMETERSSGDPRIRQLHKHRLTHTSESNYTFSKWAHQTEQYVRRIELDHMTDNAQNHLDSRGLGVNKKAKLPLRKKIGKLIREDEEAAQLDHVLSLAMQGEWAKIDHVIKHDVIFHSQFFKISPTLFNFAVRMRCNILPSPDNLSHWKITDSAGCRLCGRPKVTMPHILSSCEVARNQNRYTWRHDTVLRIIKYFIQEHIHKHNTRSPSHSTFTFIPPRAHAHTQKSISFQSAPPSSILNQAQDWQIQCDLDGQKHQSTIPSSVHQTSQRPDIVLYSASSRTMVMLELTVPMDRNIVDAHIKKINRYENLHQEITDLNWETYNFAIEVGASGLISSFFKSAMKQLGLSRSKLRQMYDEVSITTLRCTWLLWQERRVQTWDSSIAFTDGRFYENEKDRGQEGITG
jgi:hypothetical protein